MNRRHTSITRDDVSAQFFAVDSPMGWEMWHTMAVIVHSNSRKFGALGNGYYLCNDETLFTNMCVFKINLTLR